MSLADRAADETRAEPRLDAVVQALEFDILFGRLRPRERLVEDALMQRFGAKRHLVRRALDELVRLGIVVRPPNRGAAVRDFTAREVEEAYELRELLQRRAAERMVLPWPAGRLAALVAVQRRHDAAVARGELAEVDRANEAFHALVFEGCGNALLAKAIAHHAALTRAMRVHPMADPLALESLRREHWAMIEALEAGDRAALTALVVQHIQPSKRTYLALRRAMEADPG